MSIVILGIDLAKSTFSLHGVDARGQCVLRKTVSRSRLLSLIAQLPPCLIGMEACSGAHYWAREFERLGHRVGIMAAKFVAPYRTGGKNDHNDAQAICEAVSRPSMRFVAIKSEAQQALLSMHRVRTMLVKERTALINQLRGLLSEFGIVIPQGREQAQSHLARLIGDDTLQLPALFKQLLADLYQRLTELHRQLLGYDRALEQQAREHPTAKRLMTIPGIGAITATALIASVSDPQSFRNGRQFAAWLGLVPKQFTTGGKIRLGRITKRGDSYLRMLLIHGTRAVLATCQHKVDRVSCWIKSLAERRGYKRAIVALAAKNARIVWALLTTKKEYELKAV